MIKKLVISAIVLAALISAKESHAAGAGGFARALSSTPAVQTQVAENRGIERHDGADASVLTLTFAKRRELLRVNSAINSTVADLDGYFDMIAAGRSPEAGDKACFDCADLKRDHLISRGWSEKAMRIAYMVGGDGRIERVLVIATDRGDVILGNDSPVIDMSGSPLAERLPSVAPSYYDI